MKHFSRLPRVGKEEIIISLTSFPSRIAQVAIVIKTLFYQETLPNRIILWLAYEQFPNGLADLPNNLITLQKYGLEIRFCEDFKSHKKYFYTMRNNPNSVVVTVDDDVFYPKDMLTKLLEMHKLNPNAIICSSAQEIPDNYKLSPSEWNTPHFNKLNGKFGKCRILGIGGVLYPPHSLYKDLFNIPLRLKLCPWADDLWLTIMAMLNGTIIQRYEFRSNPLDVKGTQQFNLSRGGDMGLEVTQGLSNDEQWKNLINYYSKELEKRFSEENGKSM